MDNNHVLMPEILRLHAQQQPNKRAYIFLNERGEEVDELTYADLYSQSIAISKKLRNNFRPGDRALLLFEPGLDFITAFFGCLYANIIAVPVNPPRRKRVQESTKNIILDCRPSVILTTEVMLTSSQQSIEEVCGKLNYIIVERVKQGTASETLDFTCKSESTAFLQYTSGSTSSPKGVMVSHKNLISNQEMIKKAFGHDHNSTFVGWVPHYHDQGLIGNILQPLFIGATSILMAPMSFLRNPLLWLYAISQYKAHTSGGPNFAFEACTAKAEKAPITDLNLKEWKIAFNGAEPIRYDTMRRFSEVFSPFGFCPESFYPCYGLAEATLLVSGGHKGKGITTFRASPDALGQGRAIEDDNGKVLVSSGSQLLNELIFIVNPDTNRICLPDTVGEIWVAGDHVSQGYWHNSEGTQKTFHAKIDCHPDLFFLRTGDLGTIINDELYIIGRRKDIIIIRGRNYYPHDIEFTATSSHSALEPSACAAFSIHEADHEKLVLILEIKREMRNKASIPDITASIREAVMREHQISVYDIVITLPGRINKTSSGKIMRSSMKNLYINNEINSYRYKPSLTLKKTSNEAIS